MREADTLPERMKALEEALKRSKARKVSHPTVAVPRSGFARLPKVDA
jgi:hypothetical protein